VRELENTLYRSAVVAQGELILPEDLPLEVRAGTGAGEAGRSAAPSGSGTKAAATEDAEELLDRLFASLRGASAGAVLERVESALIQRALRACEGNQSEAAALLGISRSKLRTRLEPSSSGSKKSA
jgi:two-component system nitrogen regulation response regulator GlnG